MGGLSALEICVMDRLIRDGGLTNTHICDDGRLCHVRSCQESTSHPLKYQLMTPASKQV